MFGNLWGNLYIPSLQVIITHLSFVVRGKLDKTLRSIKMLWNSIVVLTFLVFNQKCPFWVNLVQKVKIICLSWNLVPTLIQICKFQWRCSLFSFPIRNALFWKNLVQNVKIVSLRLNLLTSIIRICRIQRWCSFFSFSIGNALLGQIWSKMTKLSV